MPGDESPSSNNPFIRFKHHVDANVHAGLNTISNNLSRSNSDSTQPSSSSSSSSSSYPSTTNMPYTDLMTPIDNNSNNMLSPAESHLESRIDLLRGGTAAESHLAWRLFLTRSAYSPLRLAHDLGGWHPTPRGLPPPSATTDNDFGWLEAFEDLLRVQSGLGLADLQKRRLEREQGGWFGFRSLPAAAAAGGGWGPWACRWHGPGMVGFWGGAGWGMREMAWLGRMRSQGLTEALFPVYDPELGYQSPGTREEWAERRRREHEKEAQAGRMWEEFFAERKRDLEEMEEAEREIRRLANAWADEARRDMRREVDAWADEARDKGASFFDGLGGVVRTLGKVLEDEVRSLQRYGRGERRDETAVDKKQQQDTTATTAAPETEADLYSVVQSAFHESERSLSNFFKSISDGWRDGSLAEPKPASPPTTETTEVVENGLTKKTTKKEFVDKHGNTHCKTETTWTDEHGRVVMRQVHSSMGRPQHWEKTIVSEPAKQDGEIVDVVKEEKKEGGWFWK